MTQNNAKGKIQSYQAGGDLSGTASSNTVIAMQGYPISSASPSDQNILEWNGSEWIPATYTASSYLNSSGATSKNIVLITGTYNIGINDAIIMNNTGSTYTVNLPASGTCASGTLLYTGCSDAGKITLTPYSGTTLNNSSSTITLVKGAYIICFDGTNWAQAGEIL